jgi:2-polyprenyl-3-methyl-5-hydroxy-6-metoxy-1,4-benzoquinol methylase
MPMNQPAIQEELYEFPYHFLPHFVREGVPRLDRTLDWGLQYLAYIEAVRRKVLAHRPRSVLDVGCGDGKLLSELVGAVPRLVGLDRSRRAIASANLLVPGVDFRCGEVADIDEKFDVVTCVHTLEHIAPSECDAFVAALAAAVRPGGALVVAVPSTNRSVNPKHYRHFTRQSLAQLFGGELAPLAAEYVIRRTFLTQTIRRVAVNRWFVIRSEAIMRVLWRLFVAYGIEATDRDGEQILAEFVRR